MNIQSEKVDELVQRLAHLTGENIETAVERAIEERLTRLSTPLNQAQQEKVEHLISLIRSVSKAEVTQQHDPTAPLYDDYGLPV